MPRGQKIVGRTNKCETDRVGFTGSNERLPTMKKLLLTLTAFGFLSTPSAKAGDGEWATAGKVLTGIFAAKVIHDLARPRHRQYTRTTTVYTSQPTTVVYQQSPTVVYTQQPTVVYQQPQTTVIQNPPVAVRTPVRTTVPQVIQQTPQRQVIQQPQVVQQQPQVIYQQQPQQVVYQQQPVVIQQPPVIVQQPRVVYATSPGVCYPTSRFGHRSYSRSGFGHRHGGHHRHGSFFSLTFR